MRRNPLRVVVYGRLRGAESRIGEADLAQLPADADIQRLPNAPEHWPEAAGAADLCVVLQSWPDEFPVATVRAMVSACACARLICCQGAWCAAAGRTRADWPPAVRVPIEQLGARLAFELAVLRGERDPLPFTASRDEAFAALYPAATVALSANDFEVCSPDRAYAEELQFAADEKTRSPGQRAILFDVDPWEPTMADRLAKIAHSSASKPVIALAGFPHAVPEHELTAAGAAACFPKLAPLAELQTVIARVRDDR